MNNNNNTSSYITYDYENHMLYNDFAFLAKVKDDSIKSWIDNGILKVLQTNYGIAFTKQSIDLLLESEIYKNERNKAYISLSSEIIKELNFKTTKYLSYCKDAVKKFETVHNNYRANFNILNDETPELAAYLMFAKIINLQYLIINSLQDKFLNSFILFRPLNEAIQLAEYFLITKNTEKGQNDLRKWFRKNESPRPESIRRANDKYSKNYLPSIISEFYNINKRILHYNQSKSIHNSINDINKLFIFDIENEELKVVFEYEKSTNYNELYEHVVYLIYNIPTAILGFIHCFNILTNMIIQSDIFLINEIINEITTKIYPEIKEYENKKFNI
ncbi:MAG TPA: hypothetical protein VIK14_16875 [Ignavibacteria bacterium]